MPSLSSSTDAIENVIQNQTGDEVATLKAHEMEISVANVQPVTSASESLCATISSGLSLLAQYHSDDDTDSVIEVPTTSAQDYRNNVVEINSDTDSADSTDSSDIEFITELRKTIEKRI